MAINFERLPNLVRDGKRFNEIVATLAKYGLAPWLQSVQFKWAENLFKTSDGQDIKSLNEGERMRLALSDLGTTFIKLGQILSTRPDLVGPEVTEELAKLQSSTPADSPELVRQTIQNELGTTPEELFLDFDDQAIASASIGQVHFAKLPDGTPVVVKVQHHGIEETVRNDLEILKRLAELAEHFSKQAARFRPIDTADEFSRTLLAELDFGRESRNLEQFNRNFADSPELVRFPRPYPERSARRVLTMDRIEGTSLAHGEQLAAEGYDVSQIAEQGANIFLEMIFRDGFYHADPHPGNIWVETAGRLTLLDCGMVGRIDEKLREQFEDLLMAASDRDAVSLCDIICQLGTLPKYFDENQLRVEIEEFLAEYAIQSLDEFDLGGALNRMMDIIRKFDIILPSRVTLLIKVLIMLEGTSKKLSPTFSLAEILKPYHSKIVRRRLSPERIMRKAKRNMLDWNRLIEMAPRELAEILTQIKRGQFDVHLEHRRLDKVVNRLVLGILTAALFVGSSLLWSQNVPPTLWNISVPGAVGCVIAAGMGFRLVRAIRHSGNLESRD